MGAPSDFDFVAGDLALDLTNTVANRLDPTRAKDLLAAPADLTRWLAAAGLAAPRLDAAALKATRALREHLYRLFVAIATGAALDPAALAEVDRRWRAGQSKQRLTVAGGRVTSGWAANASALDRALWPVLAAAAALLRSDQTDAVLQCHGPGCGWLFLDRSRGSKRRWCSMKDCGNRAKAQRHYRRSRDD